MERFAKLKMLLNALEAEKRLIDKAFDTIVSWLGNKELVAYHPYIDHHIDTGNGKVLLDAFWRMIPFGTGGRRGPVGAGPNRINPYTIALSVQGHCDYLRETTDPEAGLSVVVAFDVRRFLDLRGTYPGVEGILKNLTSRDLALICAETYAANGITTYVVGPLAPEDGMSVREDAYISTPELSFLIREIHAAGGLNISASHNHPDDNGGKFYNADGGQEIPPYDERLLEKVEQVTVIQRLPYAEARERGLIRFIPKRLHHAYIEVNKALAPTPSRSARIAFTPLNGTGNTTVGETLRALSFETHLVAEQSVPDGSFKAVRYRIGNPEVPESMDKLRLMALADGCDIGFATDPDADRLGVLIPDGKGDLVSLNGNEIGVLLIESILQTKRSTGTMPPKPFFINTVVTSSLQRRIAARYGCQVIGDLMVGFKYMADVLRHIEQEGRFPAHQAPPDCDSATGDLADFVFTTEEAHGYLLTPRIRDKDACGAAVHLAGLASRLKDENRTIRGMLRDIYRVYGYTSNHLRSLVMEGIDGLERIGRIQDVLRHNPPKQIAGRRVVRFVDHHEVGGPLKSGTDAASRNVLRFELENHEVAPIQLIVRPSGTEPKTKIYVEVSSASPLSGTLYDAPLEELTNVSDASLDALIAKTDALARDIAVQFIRFCLGPDVLGTTYPEIPPEALLVSDLVPVDQKIRLISDIFPELLARLNTSEKDDEVKTWLLGALKPFGEDPVGLISPAVTAWISSKRLADEVKMAGRIRAVFGLQ